MNGKGIRIVGLFCVPVIALQLMHEAHAGLAPQPHDPELPQNYRSTCEVAAYTSASVTHSMPIRGQL